MQRWFWIRTESGSNVKKAEQSALFMRWKNGLDCRESNEWKRTIFPISVDLNPLDSMVVLTKKESRKRSDYRKFKIKWVQGPNDYASMEEVLTRRFTHEGKDEFDSFSIMPDLILMDGGRGQVNIALKVLAELGS